MRTLAPLLLALSLLVAPTLARAAACVGDPGYPTAPFVDANCDACFDAADGDQAVTQVELEQQPFDVTGCFVVPSGAHVNAKRLEWGATVDITLLGSIAVSSRAFGDAVIVRAGRKLTVGGILRTSLPGVRADETNDLPVTLRGGAGVELLPRTSIKAKGTILVEADQLGDLVVGARSQVNAVKGDVVLSARAESGFGPLVPPAGHLAIGDGTQIKGAKTVLVRAAGDIDVGAATRMSVKIRTEEVPNILIRAGHPIGLADPDLGGNLTIGPKLTMSAPRSMRLEAADELHVGPRATFKSKVDDLFFVAGADLTVDDVRAAVFVVDAQSANGNVTMTGKVNLTNTGPVHFTATNGTCDLSGLDGIADADPLTYDCATVIAP